MTDGIASKAPERARGRPFEKGRSGNPLGRWVSCRNKTTIAAAAFLAGEAEALFRKAVKLVMVGDPTALRLPQCAPTGQSPWAEGPRHHQRHDHAGRGGHDSGGVGDA